MFDTNKLILAALVAIGLLAICLAWLLLGSKVDVLAKQVDKGSGIVAGPLADGVTIEQVIDVPENSAGNALHLGFRLHPLVKV